MCECEISELLLLGGIAQSITTCSTARTHPSPGKVRGVLVFLVEAFLAEAVLVVAVLVEVGVVMVAVLAVLLAPLLDHPLWRTPTTRVLTPMEFLWPPRWLSQTTSIPV